MSWETIEFGFLPVSDGYRGDGWSVVPSSDIDASILLVQESATSSDSWAYPPITENSHELGTSRRPLVAAPRFELPCTHKLSFVARRFDMDGVVLLLHALGFAKGLLLQQRGWGHLYRAAIRLGELSGFYSSPEATARIVDALNGLAAKHQEGTPVGTTAVTAMLRWFLFSQSYTRQFERFLGQYTALDALCAIYSKTTGCKLGKHFERVEKLCKALKVEAPAWVVVPSTPKSSKKTGSELSRLRNALVHEGRFGESAATIGVPEKSLLQSVAGLRELNRSLILAMLGEPLGVGEPIWGEMGSID